MLLLTMMLIAAPDSTPPTGRWKNPSGSVIVAIDVCGTGYCGTVDWASDKAKADARRGGTEALVGTQLMTGFTPAGSGKSSAACSADGRVRSGPCVVRS